MCALIAEFVHKAVGQHAMLVEPLLQEGDVIEQFGTCSSGALEHVPEFGHAALRLLGAAPGFADVAAEASQLALDVVHAQLGAFNAPAGILGHVLGPAQFEDGRHIAFQTFEGREFAAGAHGSWSCFSGGCGGLVRLGGSGQACGDVGEGSSFCGSLCGRGGCLSGWRGKAVVHGWLVLGQPRVWPGQILLCHVRSPPLRRVCDMSCRSRT